MKKIVCGADCLGCAVYKKDCSGCNESNGCPVWTKEFNVTICPIYDCAKNKKKIEHCGECSEVPCKMFVELKDPSCTDEEHQASIVRRVNKLKTY